MVGKYLEITILLQEISKFRAFKETRVIQFNERQK